MTLGEIMHHASGVPDWNALPPTAMPSYDPSHPEATALSQAQLLQAIRAVKTLDFTPGAGWEYSNSNYVLLAEVVSRVSGETLPAFLKDNVFDPLGLDMVLDPRGGLPGEALSYENDGATYTPRRWDFTAFGAGGIQTTPAQLVTWADVYRTGIVAGHDLSKDQFDGAVQTDVAAVYGAGMYRDADGHLEHGGEWLGYRSYFSVTEDRELAVAVECNSDSYDPQSIADKLLTVWG